MITVRLAVLAAAISLAACGDREAPEATVEAVVQSPAGAQHTGEALTAGESVVRDVTEGVSGAMESAGAAVSGTLQDATGAVAEVVEHAGDAMQDAGTAVTEAATPVVEAASATVAGVAASVGGTEAGPAVDLAQGKTVYSKYCIACHGTGAAGAPKLGDSADWSGRLAQGSDTLNQHALQGFKGAKGFMPPKGGFASLSDDEVKAAVGYMIAEGGD